MSILKVSAVLVSLSLVLIIAISNTDAIYIQRAVVPIPGAIWLIVSGLGFLGWFRRESAIS